MNKMTYSASEILEALRRLGVEVSLRDGIVYLAPASKAPAEIIEQVKARKPELVKLLKAEDRPAGPEPVPSKAVHREHVEMMESLAMLRQAKEQLHKEIEQEARRLNWPALVLAPWARMAGGPETWATFLCCPCHTLDQYQLVVEALKRSGGEANDTP
jgi:hypothetical protein